MESQPHEELISAYVDGELSTDERQRAEQLLADSAEARTFRDALLTMRRQLQSLPRHALERDLSAAVLGSVNSRESGMSSPVRPAPLAAPSGKQDASPDESWSTRPGWRRVFWPAMAIAAALAVMVFQPAKEKEIAQVAQHQPGQEGAFESAPSAAWQSETDLARSKTSADVPSDRGSGNFAFTPPATNADELKELSAPAGGGGARSGRGGRELRQAIEQSPRDNRLGGADPQRAIERSRNSNDSPPANAAPAGSVPAVSAPAESLARPAEPPLRSLGGRQEAPGTGGERGAVNEALSPAGDADRRPDTSLATSPSANPGEVSLSFATARVVEVEVPLEFLRQGEIEKLLTARQISFARPTETSRLSTESLREQQRQAQATQSQASAAARSRLELNAAAAGGVQEYLIRADEPQLAQLLGELKQLTDNFAKRPAAAAVGVDRRLNENEAHSTAAKAPDVEQSPQLSKQLKDLNPAAGQPITLRLKAKSAEPVPSQQSR